MSLLWRCVVVDGVITRTGVIVRSVYCRLIGPRGFIELVFRLDIEVSAEHTELALLVTGAENCRMIDSPGMEMHTQSSRSPLRGRVGCRAVVLPRAAVLQWPSFVRTVRKSSSRPLSKC